MDKDGIFLLLAWDIDPRRLPEASKLEVIVCRAMRGQASVGIAIHVGDKFSTQ